MSDPGIDKDLYQLMGEIKGYLATIREDQKELWKEIATHRNEIFGAGSDGGIKGRLKSLEIKLYVVGAASLSAMAIANEEIAKFLGGLF